jgi:hypothetical protein
MNKPDDGADLPAFARQHFSKVCRGPNFFGRPANKLGE